MWFVLRAGLVVGAIALLSPHRGGAGREASELAAGARAAGEARLEAHLAEAGRAMARDAAREAARAAVGAGAEATLRGALQPASGSPGTVLR